MTGTDGAQPRPESSLGRRNRYVRDQRVAVELILKHGMSTGEIIIVEWEWSSDLRFRFNVTLRLKRGSKRVLFNSLWSFIYYYCPGCLDVPRTVIPRGGF